MAKFVPDQTGGDPSEDPFDGHEGELPEDGVIDMDDPIDGDDDDDIFVPQAPSPRPQSQATTATAKGAAPFAWIAPQGGRLADKINEVEGRVSQVQRELSEVIQDGVEEIVVSQEEAARLRKLNDDSTPRVSAAVAAVLGTTPPPPVPSAQADPMAPAGDPLSAPTPADEPLPAGPVTAPLPVVDTTTATVTVTDRQQTNDGDRLFKAVLTVLVVFLLLTFVVVPLVRWAGEEVIKQWQGSEGRKVRVRPNPDNELTWMFWVSLGVAILAGWRAWINNRLPVLERVHQRIVHRQANTGA